MGLDSRTKELILGVLGTKISSSKSSSFIEEAVLRMLDFGKLHYVLLSDLSNLS